MCDDWEGDEKGLCHGSLVDFAGEKEVRFGGWNGSGDQGYQGSIGEVEAGEYREGVGRVSLYARDWTRC